MPAIMFRSRAGEMHIPRSIMRVKSDMVTISFRRDVEDPAVGLAGVMKWSSGVSTAASHVFSPWSFVGGCNGGVYDVGGGYNSGTDLARRGVDWSDTAGIGRDVDCNCEDKEASPSGGAEKVVSNAVWNGFPCVLTLVRCAQNKYSWCALGAKRFGLLRDYRIPGGVEYIFDE